MNLYTFTLKADCDRCGQMLAVNGPARGALCNACHAKLKLAPSLWGDQICSGSTGMRVMNNAYDCVDVGDGDPACPKCEEHFPFDQSWIRQDMEIPCPHCGFAVSTFPPPAWLADELPAAVQLVGADRPTEAGEAPTLEPDEQTKNPVMFSCPSCDAGLKITTACERTTACEHCGIEVYLPDGLWNRLHPVKTVHPWTIVYEGALVTKETMQKRQAEEAERERRSQKRIAEDADRAELARKQEKRTRLIIIGVFLAAALLSGLVILFSATGQQ